MKALFKQTTFAFLAMLFTGFAASAQDVERIPESEMKKSAIKMEFLSPLSGNLTLGYERYLKNFTSIEGKVGIIGVGSKPEGKRETGAFISIGPKFKLKPDYAQDGTYGTHVLRGGYIRPEITFGSFKNYRGTEVSSDYGETINFGSITINYGKQYVLGNIMTLDWYLGLGYGFASDDLDGYFYKNTIGSDEFPMAFNAGFTLGFLMK